jgi:putative OPT family oligopeptide transporter
VIFTLPALFLWGFDPTILQMTLLAMCGGLLGVLFMMPLRQFLIVREHGNLPYPEGTACAEVLKASEAGGARARAVFYGLGAGALVKASPGWVHGAVATRSRCGVPFLRKGELGSDVSAALFGVGYILGPRIAAVMVGGGLLSSLVIIPLIDWWGRGPAVPLFPETELLIADMEPGQIWSRYVRYIGAGAVATGGLITLVRSIPTMIESFKVGARQLRQRMGGDRADVLPRTERDLSLAVVAVGAAHRPGDGLRAAGLRQPSRTGRPPLGGGGAGGRLRLLLRHRVVAHRRPGRGHLEPHLGMTIATLLGTSTVFLRSAGPTTPARWRR